MNLPDGVKLVKSAASGIFSPEGDFYFVRDLAVPLIWSREEGWNKYYEVNSANSHFNSGQRCDEGAAIGAPPAGALG